MNKYNVLIVEDEKPAREVIKQLVMRNEQLFTVVGEAINGKQGLELYVRHRPDFLITDLTMPVMGGLELLLEIKKLHMPLPQMVILSCHQDFHYAQQAIRLGAASYLIKDQCLADEDLLVRTLEELCASLESANDHTLRETRMAFYGQERDASGRADEGMPFSGIPASEVKHWVAELQIVLFQLQFAEVQNDEAWCHFMATASANRWHPEQVINICGEALLEAVRWQAAIVHDHQAETAPLLQEIAKCQTVHQVQAALRQGMARFRENVARQYSIDEVIAKAVSRVQHNFAAACSLEELAAEAGYSVPYFSHLFKKSTGQTYTQYVRNVRINKAKYLLSSTDLKTFEIADKVGLDNYRHFNKIFKLDVGMSPSDYRRLREKQQP